MSAVPNAFENVKAVILSAHKGTTSKEKVDFYNSWAENYDQDVAVLDYRAPRLAANSISSHFRGDREAAVLLDVACGTGLVARQLKNHGFGHFVGIDGSEAMLEVARESGLYQDLKQFLLGEEPLPVQWENAFDVVVIVGALSVGQVPVCVVRDLCKSTKPDKTPPYLFSLLHPTHNPHHTSEYINLISPGTNQQLMTKLFTKHPQTCNFDSTLHLQA
ncbi:methyltransferase-like protein 27 isoform X3 [Acanthochromis polyacanthus]|uniref:Methyltransferase like 27 n=1 Tax=Acanthochromis polyacanthus TaxID=80966 RepID=A0A3Q1FF79_9TELE|nr:methyltransferase-like protein 27 isoform X3 [Acanthochromis polyacanthus]